MIRKWWELAACKGMPVNTFYPGKGDEPGRRQAIAICDTCPVKRECLSDALEHHDLNGIWGGTGKGVREIMLAQAKAKPRYQAGHGDKAGTRQGYYRERAAGLESCDDCRLAYNAFVREQRAQGRCR